MAATLALLADLALGEPSSAVHPTVWMGKWIAAGRTRAASAEPSRAFVGGAAVTLAGAAVFGGAAYLLGRQLPVSGLAREGISALALKPSLSLRGLLVAGRRVEDALVQGDVARARRLVARHLVSRDTTELSASELAGAAIESLAENLSDSVVAPLLAHRAGGIGGAYAYRFINTADAMLGYRTSELEWLGKFAARTDDVLNLAPARLTALLIALAAPLGDASVRGAVRAALRDAGETASPNAGWPMAAMAGALGCRLTKREVYVLHAAGREPDANDLRRTRRIVLAAALTAGVLL